MSDPNLVVISDLHMGAGDLDDFEEELQGHFITFLDGLPDRTELVINGDLLDFVQAPPYQGKDRNGVSLEAVTVTDVPLCFTVEQSLDKLKAIHERHSLAFQALGRFVSRPENRVTLLPGNHDVDFFFEEVRDSFDHLVGGKPVYHFDRAYRPEYARHVWIEHGQQYDPVNCFVISGYPYWSAKNPPVLQDTNGVRRLYECIGTRLLIQYLNVLDAEYPYIDNVKPYSRFWELFGASAFNRSARASLKAIVTLAAMARFLASKAIFQRSDLLSAKAQDEPTASGAVLSAYTAATREKKIEFLNGLEARRYEGDYELELVLTNDRKAAALLEFLSRNLDLLEPIDQPKAGGTLGLWHARNVNETDELQKEADKLLNNPALGVRNVVMGHTHEVVNSERYINTGSWTRYYRVPEDKHLEPWTVLQSKSYTHWPYELNYAQLTAGGVQLVNYRRRAVD